MNLETQSQILLQSRILKELEYSDLTTLRLVRRLNIGVTKLRPLLKRMQEAKLIKLTTGREEDVWRAI